LSSAAPPSRRLLAVALPVCAAGIATFAAATLSLATGTQSLATVAGVALLLVAMMLADRFPVPVEGLEATGVSLGFVFGVAIVVLFGWAPAVVTVFAAPAISQLVQHRPLLRVAYNASFHSLAAGAAGAAIAPIHGHSVTALLVRVGICALTQHAINMILITAIVGASGGRRIGPLFASNFRTTIVPFSLMASAALMLVVLWERSPLLSGALIGPLLAIALYQRSTHRELRAMRLALTDPLTGLGNQRHFHERLQRELVESETTGVPLSLCLVDIDNFKRVNDRFGHPAGDRVLAQVAGRMRGGGEAFRLGGEEFALLLPGLDAKTALEAATSVVERVRSLDLGQVGSVTVSAGVATFPADGVSRDELIRLADRALYWAKEHGKDRVHMSRPEVIELTELHRLARGGDRGARYRAAAALAKAVDARDAYTGSHSERVAELAARIATRLGVDAEQVELTRLAGSLHDLGKLALPEELLRKEGPLSGSERLLLERHPQIGFRMLESLGVDPIADWVLHHHERWDGGGYPDGIPGERIPLGARILFVADAYDAMTSDRVYRPRLDPEEALAELRRCAGTQFDPGIVAAFVAEVGAAEPVGALVSGGV
jgi:diguanylate cyclase (GGDEF)-like protein/putative nucleotidyltransferase with HDIG domain